MDPFKPDEDGPYRIFAGPSDAIPARFNIDGAACNQLGPNCPLIATASFSPDCDGLERCTTARRIKVRFRIRPDLLPLKLRQSHFL